MIVCVFSCVSNYLSALDMLAFPNAKMQHFYEAIPELKQMDPVVQAKIEIEGAYAVYLKRQGAEVSAFMRDESMELPLDLDYSAYVKNVGEGRLSPVVHCVCCSRCH